MPKEMIMKRINALLAAAAMAVSSTAAAAPAPLTIAVEAGDLDLGSNKGKRTLAMRIQRAARTMCKSQVLESMPHNIRRERGCIRQAQASAEAAVTSLIAAREQAADRGG